MYLFTVTRCLGPSPHTHTLNVCGKTLGCVVCGAAKFSKTLLILRRSLSGSFALAQGRNQSETQKTCWLSALHMAAGYYDTQSIR